MNLTDYINEVAEGRKPDRLPIEPLGSHYGCEVKRSGVLSFYVRGRLYAEKRCNSKFERQQQMRSMLSLTGSFQKKWFKWLPDIG
jgi:hypothetical protein